MKRAHSTEGYTLLEMAVVVMIMGTLAAMIAPGLGEYMADTRASGASEDLLRLNRVIRARVNQTGLAHLMLFQATPDANGSNGLGRFRVWEGMNNHCNHTPWTQAINGAADGHFVIEELDLGESSYNLASDDEAPSATDEHRQIIRAFSDAANPNDVVICFQPGGDTLVGTTAINSPAIGYTFVAQTQPITFTIRRSVLRDGTEVVRGTDREVIFPAGGYGRMHF